MPGLGWGQLPSSGVEELPTLSWARSGSCAWYHLQRLGEEDPGAEHYFQDYFLSRRHGFPEQPKANLQAAVSHC